MRFVAVTGTAATLLFFGTILPVCAQHDRQGDQQEEKQGRPDRAQGKQDIGAPRQQRTPQAEQQRRQQGHQQEPIQQPQTQPQPRAQQPLQQQQQRPQQARAQAPPERTPQQARAWQQQRGWLQQGGWQGHDTWQQNRAQRWSSEHRTWAQRGGYGGNYVPQDRFNLYFGTQHFFRLSTRPVMYLGYPRFEYGGASFLLVDPYPEYWSDNWYDANDLYIDYDDGYYLYNRSYPQVRLAITIAL